MRCRFPTGILFALAIWATLCTPALPEANAGEQSALKVDPFLLAAAEEVWQIVAAEDNPLWPGWNARDTPILIYFPGLQDLLVNHPDPPEGFVPYDGPLSFSGGAIAIRNGPTLIDWDGQNTSYDVNGVQTLVVADTLSNRRQWLRGVLGDPRPSEEKIADIDYDDLLSDPYHQLGMIVHEAFHVFQDGAAPDKGADERNVRLYPCLSVENNVGVALEGQALVDVVQADDRQAARAAALQWLAVRLDRRAALAPEVVAYEDGNEFAEGLAMFVEWKLSEVLEGREPSASLWWEQGFRGFDDLSRIRAELVQRLLENMRGEINVNNDPYGTSPVRGRLYFSGMGIAILLDRLGAQWREEILSTDATLTELARNAIAATPDELRAALSAARSRPGYNELVEAKRKAEKEGRRDTQRMLESIVSGSGTSMLIDYSALGDPKTGMSFTPFGVRAVDDARTIYTLVPISASVGSRDYSFDQKVPLPTLEDRERKQFRFQLNRAKAADWLEYAQSDAVDDLKVELDELTLHAARATVEVDGDAVRVRFLPTEP